MFIAVETSLSLQQNVKVTRKKKTLKKVQSHYINLFNLISVCHIVVDNTRRDDSELV